MVNRNLLRQCDLSEADISRELDAAFGTEDWLPADAQDFNDNKLVTGRILRVTGDVVWVDIGFKSEGAIELREWYDDDLSRLVPPELGTSVQVLLEAIQDE